MASTIAFYTGDGTTTDFTVPFDYLAKKFVKVSVGLTVLEGGDYGDTSKDYYFLDKTTVRLKTAPQAGAEVTVRRYTSVTDRIVSFKDASILKATDLDTSAIQTIHIAEEGRDVINDALIVNKEGNWDAKGHRIVNVGTPEADSDAMTYGVYKADALGAFQSKLAAEKARDRAVEAETNSKKSEENAKLSEVNAQASAGTAVSASKHVDAVKVENQAILQEAKEIRDENKVLDANTKDNANVAQVKANEAKVSETNAKASEVEAKKQADIAKQYADQAVAGQVQADWAQTNSTKKDFIKNKPTLGALASKDSIAYSEITGTPPEQDLSGLATKSELQTGLASKANSSHTHTVSQITDIPKVVLSVNNITPDAFGNVPLGLHAIATSGNYNDLMNKPYIPANTSNWSVSVGINGWARDNSTGFTIQWGSSGESAGTLTFPITFSQVLSLSFQQVPAENKGHSDWYVSTPYSLNPRNFSFSSYYFNGTVKYIAIGFT